MKDSKKNFKLRFRLVGEKKIRFEEVVARDRTSAIDILNHKYSGIILV